MDTPSGQQVDVNEYWQNHPKNILGTLNFGHGTTSGRPGMIVDKPADLQGLLQKAIKSLPENIFNADARKSLDKIRANDTKMRQSSVVMRGGEPYVVQGEHLVPINDIASYSRKGTKAATIAAKNRQMGSLLEVRDA